MIFKKTSKEFIPAPEGLFPAVCVDIVDLGEVDWGFGMKPRCAITWAIDERMESGEPYIVQKRYNVSLHEKATLRRDLESWRGRAFTENELQGFDSENLIGVHCQVQIAHQQGTKDKTRIFANVRAVVPLGRHMPKMPMPDYVRVQDRVTKDIPEPDHAEDEVPF